MTIMSGIAAAAEIVIKARKTVATHVSNWLLTCFFITFLSDAIFKIG